MNKEAAIREALRKFIGEGFDLHREFSTDSGLIWRGEGVLNNGQKFWISFNVVTEQGLLDHGEGEDMVHIVWKVNYNTVVRIS